MKATKFSQFLQSREELKFVDRPHWIYLLEAVIWSIIIIAIGFFAQGLIAKFFIYPSLSENIFADGFFLTVLSLAAQIVLWGSILFSLIYFINNLIFWASTYVFSSDRRIFVKTGLIRVLVKEVSFEEIRKTDINYGLLGRFLGYGKLMMDARFVEDSNIPYTYCPEKFVKLIHYANDLAGDINISYITNNMEEEADEILARSDDVSSQVKPQREHEKFVNYAFSDGEAPDDEGENPGDVDKKLSKPADQTLNKDI